MEMKLIPIGQTPEENQDFFQHPDCRATIQMSIDFYGKKGFDPPWIGYYAEVDGELVGSAAFKGQPVAGKVEIAYGTFPQYQHRGIGTEICHQLILLSLHTDPSIRITAQILPENNASARVLAKNGFICKGAVLDEEDGEVWEWEYKQQD